MKATILRVSLVRTPSGPAVQAAIGRSNGCECPFCEGRPLLPRLPTRDELQTATTFAANELDGQPFDALSEYLADRLVDGYLRHKLADWGSA